MEPERPESTSEPRPRPPKRVSLPRVKEIPEGQREHEGPLSYNLSVEKPLGGAAKDRHERAQELGLCRDCREQDISNQTR